MMSLRIGVVVLAALLPAACGGGGAKSADEIAGALRTAAGQADGAPALKEEAENTAMRTICEGLGAYSSQPAQTITEYLQQEAAREEVAPDVTLSEYDSELPDVLTDAADEIEDTQQAAEVIDILGCN